MLHPHTLASMAPMDTGKSLESTSIFPIFFSFSNGAAGGGGAGGWTAPHANVRISCSAGITTWDTRLCCQALASINSNCCIIWILLLFYPGTSGGGVTQRNF